MKSLHNRLVTFAITLCIGCSVSGAVFAEGSPPQSEGQYAQAAMQRMHLTATQQKKFLQIEQSVGKSPEWRNAAHDFQVNHNTAAYARRINAVIDHANVQILAILNPTQRKEWKQYFQQAKQRQQAIMKQRQAHAAAPMRR